MRGKALAISIVFLSLFFAAIMAELFLRATQTVTTYTEKIYGLYQTPYNLHPVTHPPNIRSRFLLKGDGVYYDLETNSEGLRDREHPLKKEPGQYRILALGDSFTEGVGASLEESWPKQLENLLNERTLPVQITVISGGRAGSDPVLCYRRLTERLLKYGPDMVILATNSSDYQDLAVRGPFYAGKGGLAAPRGEYLWQRSHLFRLFSMVVLKWNYYLVPQKKWRQMEAEGKELFADCHEKFALLGKEQGFIFLHIHHPFPFELEKGVLPDKQALSEQAYLKIANITPCMQQHLGQKGPRESYSHKHDGHYNAAGYRQFALCVMEVLEAQGIPNILQQSSP